jgi:Mor family transcriptional regulator
MQRCIDTVLDYVYSRIPAKAPKMDKTQRDAQIYGLHLQGETNDELAKQFLLSVKHIERIIREQQRKP